MHELKLERQNLTRKQKHLDDIRKKEDKANAQYQYNGPDLNQDLTNTQIFVLGLAAIAAMKMPAAAANPAHQHPQPQNNSNSSSLSAGNNGTAIHVQQQNLGYQAHSTPAAAPAAITTNNIANNKKTKFSGFNPVKIDAVNNTDTCPAEEFQTQKPETQKDQPAPLVPLTENGNGIKFTMSPALEEKIRKNPELEKIFLSQKQLINTVIAEIQAGKTAIDKTIFNQLFSNGLSINWLDPDELPEKYATGAAAFVHTNYPRTIQFILKSFYLEKMNLAGIQFTLFNEIHHIMVLAANADCSFANSEDLVWACGTPLFDEKNELSRMHLNMLKKRISAIDKRVDLLHSLYQQKKSENLFKDFSAEEKDVLHKLIKQSKGLSFSDSAMNSLSPREKGILVGIIKDKSSQLNSLIPYEKFIYKFLASKKTVITDIKIMEAYHQLINEPYEPIIFSTPLIDLKMFTDAVSAYEERIGKKLNLNFASEENPVQVSSEFMLNLMSSQENRINFPCYITGVNIQGSKIIFEYSYGNGIECFIAQFLLRKNTHNASGLYDAIKFSHLTASENEQAKEMKKMSEVTERSSDMQSTFYDPKLMELIAPEWNNYFKNYFKTHFKKNQHNAPHSMFFSPENPFKKPKEVHSADKNPEEDKKFSPTPQ